MKKIFALIIISLSFFSIADSAKADWLMEITLDLNYWPEKFDLNLPKMWNYYFYNSDNYSSLKVFKSLDISLRTALETEYENWNISEEKMNWLIKSYSLFIFHINKYFYYLSVLEKNPSLTELNVAISKNYRLARGFFREVQNNINK